MEELLFKNKQLICDPINGDCFRACLTSILGMPNSPELPNGQGWFGKWSKFLYERGLSIQYDEQKVWREGFWIASVKSKNFPDVTHSIIMRGQEIYFDPSPKDTYLVGENLLGKNTVLGGWWLEINNIHKIERAKDAELSRLKAEVEELKKIIEQKSQLECCWHKHCVAENCKALLKEWMEYPSNVGLRERTERMLK